MATGLGFEPRDGFPPTVFRTAAISRSATPPYYDGFSRFRRFPRLVLTELQWIHIAFDHQTLLLWAGCILIPENILGALFYFVAPILEVTSACISPKSILWFHSVIGNHRQYICLAGTVLPYHRQGIGGTCGTRTCNLPVMSRMRSPIVLTSHNGVPCRTWTCNRWIRNPLFYPLN